MQPTTPPPIIFLYYYDLLKIFHHITSRSGAHTKYQSIKKCLGKQDHQFITVKEFADWQDVPVDDVIQIIRA